MIVESLLYFIAQFVLVRCILKAKDFDFDYVSTDSYLYVYGEYLRLKRELDKYKEGCKCIDKQISLKT